MKIFAEVRLDTIAVLFGLAFLVVAVVGKISGRIGLVYRVPVISAGIGICLIVSGIWIRREYAPFRSQPVHEVTSTAVDSNVHAQELVAVHHPTNGDLPSNQHPTAGLSYFAGKWKNKDLRTRGLTTLDVRTANQAVWVHAWSACRPTECDWGEAPGTPLTPSVSTNSESDAQKVTAVFETSFSNTRLTLTPADDDELRADTQTRFTDNSGRSGYSATYTFRH